MKNLWKAIAVACLVSGVLCADDLACRMSPDNDEDNVVSEGDSLSLTCDLQQSGTDEVLSCIWTHSEPMNEDNPSPDVTCTSGVETSGQVCREDTRIKYITSSTSCGIQIANTEPEDTGIWKLDIVKSVNGQSSVSPARIFLVRAYTSPFAYRLRRLTSRCSPSTAPQMSF